MEVHKMMIFSVSDTVGIIRKIFSNTVKLFII